jgi:hypothetical protein
MTKKKRQTDDFVNYWKEEIRAGQQFMKKYSTSDRWKEFRQMYRGDWKETIVPVNRIFSYGRSLIPRVYFRSPRVCVTATRPELVPHALVVEAVDNWLIRETKLKKTLKMAALHSYISGVGPIKLGYDSEFGYLPDQSVDVDAATVSQEGRTEGRRIEYHVNVKPGMPWALPMLPEDFIIPWGYQDLSSVPWVAHRVYRLLEDVKQDQKYKNTSKLQGTRTMDRTTSPRRTVFDRAKDVQFAELFEIRDLRYREIIVLCEDEVLLKDRDALQIEGHNYECVAFNEDPEFFWAIPDTRILEPQQLELNDVRTQSQRHRRIALLKFLYQKGTITEVQLDKFLSGKVGVAVEVEAESLLNAITTLQPHMPPELWQEALVIIGDMRESLGFSENQLGAFSRRQGTTATETMQVAQSTDIRVDERKDIMADVLVDVIRKWNQYIFSFWDTERVVKIVGPEGGEAWVSYTGDELRGEYSLTVDPESGFPITSEARRNLFDNLIKVYGGDALIDQIRLRQLHLSQYENVVPGLQSLVQPPLPITPEGAAAAARQPSPILGGGRGALPGTNQGGGQRGFTPQNPMPFEQFKKNFQSR